MSPAGPSGMDPASLLAVIALQALQRPTDSHSQLATPVVRAFDSFEEMSRRRTDQPLQVIREFREDCVRRRRPRPQETWTYREIWATEDYKACRNVGRFAFMLQEAMEELDRGRIEVAHATIALGWRACRQYALDRSTWRAAWLLTGLTDPYTGTQWGGTPEQLSKIAAYLKAQDDLKNRVGQGAFQQTPGLDHAADANVDEEHAVQPAAKPRGRRAKAKAASKD